MGLKDQVIALRWIRRNIAAFGGDPDCVTITGYSAGGVSALLHMVSPMTKDLFHRVIMMSGSTAPDPFPTNQSHLAKKQAELLGCPTDTTGAMLVCLISKPVEDFTNTMTKFFVSASLSLRTDVIPSAEEKAQNSYININTHTLIILGVARQSDFGVVACGGTRGSWGRKILAWWSSRAHQAGKIPQGPSDRGGYQGRIR